MESKCQDCMTPVSRCICKMVDEFFEDNRDLMDELAEIERREDDEARGDMCLACWYVDCRCSEGYSERNK